jgi:hypothetical protein
VTRYAELWRKEQADKERLQTQLERQLKILIDEKHMLVEFIVENGLQNQLAEWAMKRQALPPAERTDVEKTGEGQ